MWRWVLLDRRLLPRSCVAAFDFSIGASGGLVRDLSGMCVGPHMTGGSTAPGPGTRIMEFDGVDDTCWSDRDVRFNASGWSLGGWMRVDDVETWSMLFGWSFGLRPEIANELGAAVVYVSDTPLAATVGTVFTVGEWMHLVVTCTLGVGHAIYLNGESLALSSNSDGVGYYEDSAAKVYVVNVNSYVAMAAGLVCACDECLPAGEVARWHAATAHVFRV